MVRRTGTETWDLAGFTDLQSRLGRFVPTGKLLVYKDIKLDDSEQHLLCDHQAGLQVVRPARDLFDGFLELAEAPASGILRYARKWGTLFLDPQGRPCTKAHGLTFGAEGQTWIRSEPLEAWRYFSRRARAVLNIAGHLQQGKRGSASDWAALDSVQDRIGPEALHELSRRGLLELYATAGCSPYGPTWSMDKQRRFLTWELMLWLGVDAPWFCGTSDSTVLADGDRL